MSQPYSRYLRSFETTARPCLEPEVERAVLASFGTPKPTRGGPGKRDAAGRPVPSTLQ